MVTICILVCCTIGLISCRDVLKEKIHPALFFVFNVAFISLAQSVLLFMVSTPTYVMLLTSRLTEKMETPDIIFARVLMGLVVVEFFADQQQWGIPSTSKTINLLFVNRLQIIKRPRNPT